MKNRPFAWGRAPADFFDIVHKFQTEFLAKQTPGGPIGLPGVLCLRGKEPKFLSSFVNSLSRNVLFDLRTGICGN